MFECTIITLRYQFNRAVGLGAKGGGNSPPPPDLADTAKRILERLGIKTSSSFAKI